jgi:hypothetical protein
MNTQRIISELTTERDRVDQAIAALRTLSLGGQQRPVRRKSRAARPPVRSGRRLSAAGRKRLSELMKQRWAERRRKKAA